MHVLLILVKSDSINQSYTVNRISLSDIRHEDTNLPIGCQEKAEGGGFGQILVGMVTDGFCWSRWCWRSDHSGKNQSPGGRDRKRDNRYKLVKLIKRNK